MSDLAPSAEYEAHEHSWEATGIFELPAGTSYYLERSVSAISQACDCGAKRSLAKGIDLRLVAEPIDELGPSSVRQSIGLWLRRLWVRAP